MKFPIVSALVSACQGVSRVSSCGAFLELLQTELLKEKIAFSLELTRPLDVTL